jgi:divalent metal cation (Fe/Co/Zn/Cd) transporter
LGFLISLMLFYAVFEIIKNSASNLLGEKPDKNLIGDVKKLIDRVSNREICPHHFHLHTYGDHKELTFHIMLNGSLDISAGHEIATTIENALREEMNIESTIHVQPDLD